ncbi:MAG: hypothetical protein GY948_25545 [Alphaproteobacteria bacterium]|nr:hypothetical protein [Alphaproteobacteria bacterium]
MTLILSLIRPVLASLAIVCLMAVSASGQTQTAEEKTAEENAVRSSLQAITSILEAQSAKRDAAKELRRQIDKAQTDVDKKDLGEKLKEVNAELAKFDDQIVSLATGVSAGDFKPANEKFELQEELQQLIRPFVWILKSATENARQIEHLKRSLLAAKRQEKTAGDAISHIQPMIERAPKDGAVGERLQSILQNWEQRRIAAKDRGTTAQQQLQARLSERVDARDTANRAFSSFFSNRGRNLSYGILTFAVVILVMRLLRRLILHLIGVPRNRSFPVRLGSLIYDIATAATAFATAIAIFNYYNDWLLTGFMLILFIAIGWFILKSLPAFFEQITLLLNLGAVQEGERVVFNGIPWRVNKLDLYSSLENPSLRGGLFTVPVRELRGQHSRPMDEKEHWFPSEEGDWVVLENGLWAEVILQSPEAVHLREEGGSVSHFTTQAFLEQNPKNVSRGYRSTIEFGIDYSHQTAAASGEISKIMRDYVDREIRELVDSDKLLATFVTLFRAGSSSLDYEIEVDVAPGTGHLYDPIMHAMARIAVECCTENGWTIPFPQLTVHRQ